MKRYKDFIKESGLSKIWSHINNYDIALITAWRDKLIDCAHYESQDEQGSKVTKSQKKMRNRELKASLLNLKYGVTSVDGSYIENFGAKAKEKEVKEDSFFVVNLKNDPAFFKNIKRLGEFYCQDSVLLKPKGKKAYLLGTNYSDFPGYGNKENVGNFKGGIESMFMSKVKGRPFIFEEVIRDFYSYNWGGKRSIHNISKKIISFLGYILLKI